MQPLDLHSWDVSPEEAEQIQETLRSSVAIGPPDGTITTVAGCDVAHHEPTGTLAAAVVVCALSDDGPAEIARAEAVVAETFPYLPGLFAFRELPPIVSALRALTIRPDLLLLDGHGMAHPRRFGLACHAGVLFDVPAIGCAKTWLAGHHTGVDMNRGSRSTLLLDDEPVGCVLRTRDDTRPVYVSPGHRIDLDTTIRIVLEYSPSFRIPEPLRLAHQAANALRATL